MLCIFNPEILVNREKGMYTPSGRFTVAEHFKNGLKVILKPAALNASLTAINA